MSACPLYIKCIKLCIESKKNYFGYGWHLLVLKSRYSAGRTCYDCDFFYPLYLLHHGNAQEIMNEMSQTIHYTHTDIYKCLIVAVKSQLKLGNCYDNDFYKNFSIFCSLGEEFMNIFWRDFIMRCNVICRSLYKILEEIGLKVAL